MKLAPLALAGALLLWPDPVGATEQHGLATYYAKPQRIACPKMGRFDPEMMTAASRDVHKLGCGTLALVTNIKNGKSVLVVLTDWGPAEWTGVDIDLSRAAFREIAPLKDGKIPVTVTIMRPE